MAVASQPANNPLGIGVATGMNEGTCPEKVAAMKELRELLRGETCDGLNDFRIHWQHVPKYEPDPIEGQCCEANIPPFMWFEQFASERERTLSCNHAEPDVVSFNIDIAASDPSIAKIAEGYLVELLESYEGEFGSIRVQDIAVQSQDDDYESLLRFANAGVHIQSITIDITPLWVQE